MITEGTANQTVARLTLGYPASGVDEHHVYLRAIASRAQDAIVTTIEASVYSAISPLESVRLVQDAV